MATLLYDNSPAESRLRSADTAILILRLVFGVIIFAHGAQKVLGWYGGPGMAATVQGMSGMGIPAPLVYLSSFTELLGGLALILGLLTRPAALGLAINMAVAVVKVHLPNGLFSQNQGFEFPLSLLAIALAVLIYGAGAYSLDALLFGRRRAAEVTPTGRPITV
jgi:putative oxidoreductase